MRQWDTAFDALKDLMTTLAPKKFWSRRGALLVTNHKLPAVAWVVRFETWPQALADVRTLDGKR